MGGGGSLGSLVVSLTAQTAQFNSAMDKAAYTAEKRTRAINQYVDKVAKTIGVALAAAAGAALYAIKNLVEEIDDMGKKAQMVGQTTEEFSKLAYAAKLSGATTEDLVTSFSRLSRNMADASEKGIGEAADAFAKLRIKVKNADGSLKDSSQIIDEIADRFQKTGASAETTSAAMVLLGKSGAKLIPMLAGGSAGLAAMKKEAADLGVVITEDLFRASEAFNDNMTRMGMLAKGVGMTLLRDLMPVMVALSDEMVTSAKESDNFSIAGTALKTVLQTLIIVGSEVGYTFKTLGRNIVVAKDLVSTFAKDGARAAADLWVETRKVAIQAEKDHKAFMDRVLNPPKVDTAALEAEAKKRAEIARKAFLAEVRAQQSALRHAQARKAGKSEIDKQREALEKMIDSLEEESITLGMTNSEIRIRRFEMAGATKAQLEHVQAIQDTIDATKEAQESQRRLNEMLGATPTAELKKTQEDMLLLAEALERKDITEAEYIEAVQTRLGTLPDEVKQVADRMTEFAQEAGRNMQSAFANFLFDPFQNGLKGMLTSFSNTIQRMSAEALSAEILGRVGSWGKENAGGDSFLGMVASGVSSIFGGTKAGGGPVYAGQHYLVGENGPEIVTMGRDGNVTSSAQSVIQQHNHFHVQGSIDMRTQQQIATITGLAASRAIRRNA